MEGVPKVTIAKEVILPQHHARLGLITLLRDRQIAFSVLLVNIVQQKVYLQQVVCVMRHINAMVETHLLKVQGCSVIQIMGTALKELSILLIVKMGNTLTSTLRHAKLAKTGKSVLEVR